MDERTLLELAAKAAGMAVLAQPWNNDDGWFYCMQHGNPAMHFRKADNPHYHSDAWAPLTDDGDALRLAVNLSLEIRCYSVMGNGCYIEIAPSHDRTAGVRRAIVCAAAEIGKAMP